MGHICCCPFQRLHDSLLDHRFWVVVLDALHLMASLFVRYLHFTGCHIATESAYFWGADLQTHGQGSYELAHISSCWCRMWCLQLWSCRDPSPSWKGDLLVILLWGTTAQRACPISRRGIAGGAIDSCCTISCDKSLTSCQSSLSFKSPSCTCI